MSPDSEIESKTELSTKKFDYMINLYLAPYFQKQCFDALLVGFLLNAPKLSLCLNETFNRRSNKQMDYKRQMMINVNLLRHPILGVSSLILLHEKKHRNV